MSNSLARKGSAFTLLFAQAELTLVREMPINAAARIIEITDKRLWRIVSHAFDKAVAQFDWASVEVIGLDETASKRGQNYVTVFIDMQRAEAPIFFVTPGISKATFPAFVAFLKAHHGEPGQITQVVCDMSGAFLSAAPEHLPNAQIRSIGFISCSVSRRRWMKSEKPKRGLLRYLRICAG